MVAARRLCGLLVTGSLLWVSTVGPTVSSSPDKKSLPVRGLVRPLNQAAITTDLAARVAVVRFKEGETFRKGDLLIAFDCERQNAELAAVRAVHREAQLALDSATYLDKKGAVGRFDVDVARSRADKAASEVAVLDARIKQCAINAPYDGRVTELTVNAHEMPAPGRSMISIVDETTYEIELIVPSNWLRRLDIGATFKFAVDELDKTYTANLVRIGAAVDPVSQTVKVIGVFVAKPDKVLPGMSGSAIFEGRDS